MKFLAKIVLACLSACCLLPSLLSASQDMPVVASELSQCLAGVKCVQQTGGAWVCARNNSVIQNAAVTVCTNLSELGKHVDSGDTPSLAIQYVDVPASAGASIGRMSPSFAQNYVGVVKIQV